MTQNSIFSSADSSQDAVHFTPFRDVPISYRVTRNTASVRSVVPRLVLPVQTIAERVLFTALTVLTLPMIAYSSLQLWNFVSSNALERAVLSFVR